MKQKIISLALACFLGLTLLPAPLPSRPPPRARKLPPPISWPMGCTTSCLTRTAGLWAGW